MALFTGNLFRCFSTSLFGKEWRSKILRNNFVIGTVLQLVGRYLVPVLLVPTSGRFIMLQIPAILHPEQNYWSKSGKFGEFVRKGFIFLTWRREGWVQCFGIHTPRIPDPKKATKKMGEVVIPFFVATNFTKLIFYLFLKCGRKKFGQVFKEL